MSQDLSMSLYHLKGFVFFMDPHYSVVSHELVAVQLFHSVATTLQALMVSLKEIPLIV